MNCVILMFMYGGLSRVLGIDLVSAGGASRSSPAEPVADVVPAILLGVAWWVTVQAHDGSW